VSPTPSAILSRVQVGVGRRARIRLQALTRLALSSRQAAVERYGASAVPTAGITVGLARLLQARECWLLVTGERKASILRRALEAPEGPDCPASYLRRHARLRVIVDEPAAAELRPRA